MIWFELLSVVDGDLRGEWWSLFSTPLSQAMGSRVACEGVVDVLGNGWMDGRKRIPGFVDILIVLIFG